MFSGAFGDYLLDPEVSGIAAPQAEALRGIMRVCGLIRVKGVKSPATGEGAVYKYSLPY